MNKNQRGFHIIEAILIIGLISAIGFVGWYVYSKKQSKSSESTSTTTSSQTSGNVETWQKGDYAIKGKFADADVVNLGNGKYRMYYAIQPEVSGHKFEVFSATSTDGKTWKQETGERKQFATFPDVIKLPNGKWRMYYQNANSIKSAISSDGLNFTDESGTRISTSGHTVDLGNVAASTTYQQDDGTYVMVYRGDIEKQYKTGVPNQSTTLLFWATSKDGLSFEKQGIALDSRNDTFEGWMDGPDFVKWDDNSIKLTFWGYQGVYESTFDGSKFSDAELAYDAAQSNSQPNQPEGMYPSDIPGDPTMMKISDTWFMYYGSTGEKSGIHYFTLR